MKAKPYENKRNAFTLVEIMMVLILLGILSAMSIMTYAGFTDMTTESSRAITERTATNAVHLHIIKFGRMPASAEELNFKYDSNEWDIQVWGDTANPVVNVSPKF